MVLFDWGAGGGFDLLGADFAKLVVLLEDGGISLLEWGLVLSGMGDCCWEMRFGKCDFGAVLFSV